MRGAKAPRLHHPLARHQLDLSALHSPTKDGEGITFAIGNLGRPAGCGAEQAAAGEQLEHLLRRRGDERVLTDKRYGWRHWSPFCFAASSVRTAAVRVSAAKLEVVAQARNVEVPAARAHVDALQFLAQTLVVELKLRCVAVDR